MKKDIKKIVSYYVQKYNTRNPFELAGYLKVQVMIGDLGSRSGCYMFLKNHKCIFLHQDLSEQEMRMVMAHELGHAILHRKENCYFIRNKTFLLTSRHEVEANTFAAELLLSDDMLLDYKDYSKEQLARLFGIHKKLVDLKTNLFKENLYD